MDAGTPCTHLRSLVLEPDLHHTDTQPCLCCQRLPHLGEKSDSGVSAHLAFQGDFRKGQISQGKSLPSTQDIPKGWRQLGTGPSPHTFLQGLEETSNDALNALRCCVVRMVRGRLGRL